MLLTTLHHLWTLNLLVMCPQMNRPDFAVSKAANPNLGERPALQISKCTGDTNVLASLLLFLWGPLFWFRKSTNIWSSWSACKSPPSPCIPNCSSWFNLSAFLFMTKSMFSESSNKLCPSIVIPIPPPIFPCFNGDGEEINFNFSGGLQLVIPLAGRLRHLCAGAVCPSGKTNLLEMGWTRLKHALPAPADIFACPAHQENAGVEHHHSLIAVELTHLFHCEKFCYFLVYRTEIN